MNRFIAALTAAALALACAAPAFAYTQEEQTELQIGQQEYQQLQQKGEIISSSPMLAVPGCAESASEPKAVPVVNAENNTARAVAEPRNQCRRARQFITK